MVGTKFQFADLFTVAIEGGVYRFVLTPMAALEADTTIRWEIVALGTNDDTATAFTHSSGRLTFTQGATEAQTIRIRTISNQMEDATRHYALRVYEVQGDNTETLITTQHLAVADDGETDAPASPSTPPTDTRARVDFSQETTAQTIRAGDTREHIIAGRGDDTIHTGQNDDLVVLDSDDDTQTPDGTDEVHYTLSMRGDVYVAYDGNDTITGFKRNEDKIVFAMPGAVPQGQTPTDYFLSGINDKFHVRPLIDIQDDNSALIIGLLFMFPDAVILPDGRLSLPLMSIYFDTPMSAGEFIAAITNDEGTWDYDAPAMMMTTARALKAVLGSNSILAEASAVATLPEEAEPAADMMMAVYENHPLNKPILDIDGDQATSGTYRLAEGVLDNDFFTINSAGEIWWKSLADYEAASDITSDNVYRVRVTHEATDGTITITHLAIDVQDIVQERVGDTLGAQLLSGTDYFTFHPGDIPDDKEPSTLARHLLYGSAFVMPAQGPLILTWSFDFTPEGSGSEFLMNVLNTQEKIAEMRAILNTQFNMFESHLNIKFVEVGSQTNDNGYDRQRGDIAVSVVETFSTSQDGPIIRGRATLPGGHGLLQFAAPNGDLTTLPDWILAHEIAHALGLAHPFESNNGWLGNEAYRSQAADWTVMSYLTGAGRSLQTLYPADIEALQFLYGAAGEDWQSPERFFGGSVARTLIYRNSVFRKVSFDEGQAESTVVYTLVAQDFRNIPTGVTLTFTLALSKYDDYAHFDNNLFTIDATTGELRFRQTPDFEMPRDGTDDPRFGGDNIYHVRVNALYDHPTIEDTRILKNVDVFVHVRNIDENAPDIPTDITASIHENRPLDKAVYEIDTPQAGSYALTAGVWDNDLFTIDNDGKIWLRALADYETPRDTNSDNVYHIRITHTAPDNTITHTRLDLTINDIAFERIGNTQAERERTGTDFITTRAARFDDDDLPSALARLLLSGTAFVVPVTGVLELTWSFDTSPSDNALLTPAAIATMRGKLRDAMAEFESNINIKFIEVVADSDTGARGDISISVQIPPRPISPPRAESPEETGSVAFIAPNGDLSSPTLSHAFIVRELARALGLVPPHEEKPHGWQHDLSQANSPLTVMSNAPESFTRNPALQDADIEALQFLYGAQGTDWQSFERLLPRTFARRVVTERHGDETIRDTIAFAYLATARENLLTTETISETVASIPLTYYRQRHDDPTIYQLGTRRLTTGFELPEGIPPRSFFPEHTGTSRHRLQLDPEYGDSTLFTTKPSETDNVFLIGFRQTPDYENPHDGANDPKFGRNNVYEIKLTETVIYTYDGTEYVERVPLFLQITITDNVEFPLYENHPTNKAIYDTADINIADAQAGSFSLPAVLDNNLFTLTDGKIFWRAQPDYEVPRDVHGLNFYRLDILHTAADGEKTTTSIDITLQDILAERAGDTLAERQNTGADFFTFTPDDIPDSDKPQGMVRHLISGTAFTMPATGALVLTWSFDLATANNALATQGDIDAMRVALNTAFAEFEAAANLKFVEVGAASRGDIAIAVRNQIDNPALATADKRPDGVGQLRFYADGGDISTIDHATLIREIGYAVGLSTPDASINGWQGDTQASQADWTIMSANSDWDSEGLQDADEAALRFLYGAPNTQWQSAERLIGYPRGNRDGVTLSARIEIDENTTTTRVVFDSEPFMPSATEFTNPTVPTFSLRTGVHDNDLFTIDSDDGEVRFRQSPDYENPHDGVGDTQFGQNNLYLIEVSQTLTATRISDNTPQTLNEVTDIILFEIVDLELA